MSTKEKDHEVLNKHPGMNNFFRAPPIQRQRWGDKQILPHTNWGDLFFDLFYVAAAYNLAHIIKPEPNLVSLLYFLGCFGPIKNMWDLKTIYDAKYQSPDDVFHMILEFAQLSFVATAVLHIRPVGYMSHGTSNPEMFLFCVSILIGYTYHTMRYLEIRLWGVIGQACASYDAVTVVLGMIPGYSLVLVATIYSAVLFYNSDDHTHDDSYHHRLLAGGSSDNHAPSGPTHHGPIILMFSSWIVNAVIIFPLRYVRGKGANFKMYSVPMNIDFMMHRHGEWSMLMLGESVLSLLISTVVDEKAEFYITFYVGVLSVILLQYLYFKSRPQHPDDHVMRRSRVAAFIFSFIFSCYSAALILVGVGFKMLLSEYTYDEEAEDDTTAYGGRYARLLRFLAGGKSIYPMEERKQRTSYFFCLSLAALFICLDWMTILHNGIKPLLDRCICPKLKKFRAEGIFVIVVMRILGILFIASACFYISEPEQVALAGLCSIILQVCIRVVGRRYFPVEKKIHSPTHQHIFAHLGQSNMVDEEVNEEHWPNTSQPLHIQQD